MGEKETNSIRNEPYIVNVSVRIKQRMINHINILCELKGAK